MGILRQAGAFRPVGDGWGGGAVCGRVAAGSSRHGGITSDTAGSRNAWLKCGVGRRRSGNRGAARNLGRASGMPRRSGSGENAPEGARVPACGWRRPKSQRRTRARGHAADGIPRFFATVPAVTSRYGNLLAHRRRIAGTSAARPCVRSATVNASVCGARPQRADSSAVWNTRRHGPNAVKIVLFPAAMCRGGRRCRLI
jgi:hypothetical protein